MPNLRQLLHPIYRNLETTVHPLRYLFLEITQKCNLYCLHCGSDCGRQPMANELTTNEWVGFIQQLSSAYTKKREKPHLVLTGGEPLLCEGLDAILSEAAKGLFPVGMVTNGYRLNAATVNRLVAHRLYAVTVSLDGLELNHDWLRGKSGSFKRARDGIALLAKSPIRMFDVVTCVNPRNLPQLQKIYKLLESLGVRRWRLFNIFPKGRAADNAELMLSEEQIVEMLQWIRATRINGGGIKVDFACEGYLPLAVDRQVRDEPYFCRAGIAIGSVLADGAISACPNISRNFVQGNIREDDFFDVWENRYEKFRNRNWMRTGTCQTCKEWGRCKGNSLHLWDEEKGETGLCYYDIVKNAKRFDV